MTLKYTAIIFIANLSLSAAAFADTDKSTEGDAGCKDCSKKIQLLPIVDSAQLAIEDCWRKHLAGAAKRKVESDFKGAPKGLCAGGVQSSLGEAGFLPSKFPKPDEPHKGNLGYWHGDAIDFHDRGPSARNELNRVNTNYALHSGMSYEPGFGLLHDLGFRNIIDEYPDDRKCLPGTVLVYASGIEKYEKLYQETGQIQKHIEAEKRKKGKKYVSGLTVGDSVGHVTVCGETKNKDGKTNVYYTDGKTVLPAQPQRRLVGVYTMSTCKECHPATTKICQKVSRREENE